MHTTERRLLEVFCWRAYSNTLKETLSEISTAAAGELLKFLHSFCDTLFEIAAEMPRLRMDIFDVLVHAMRLCDDSGSDASKQLLG